MSGDGTPALRGRGRELAALADLLADARTGHAGVVEIIGEPGVGKTALAAQAAASSGMPVLRALGVQGESHLPLAALSELLRPLRGLAADLSTAQRAAVGSLFDGGGEPVADRFALGAATLALLARAAEDAPLLVVIDDAHWVDDLSGAVLSFALRRLVADAVAVLLCRRPLLRRPIAGPWRELHLGGLAAQDAAALLGPATAPSVAATLHEVTGGNPLALRELARVLHADHLAGRAELPDPLPLGPLGTTAFAGRIGELPEATRRGLTVLAAAGPGGTALLPVALPLVASRPADLEPAEREGLVVLDGGRPAFLHPLVRAAAFAAADPAQRRAAHRALAAACPDDVQRRARHLAAAAVLPDEEVAVALERAAEDAERRGGPAAGAAARLGAARLAPDGPQRDARRLRAAEVCLLAGRRTEAIALAEEVLAAGADAAHRHRALALRATVAVWTSGVADAKPMMWAAFEELADAEPDLAALVAFELAAVAASSGSLHEMVRAAQRGRDLDIRDPLVRYLAIHRHAGARAWVGDLRAEAGHLVPDARCAHLARQRLPAHDPMTGQYLMLVERFAEARQVADRDVEAARHRGAPATLPVPLMMRADLALVTGSALRARADLDEVLDLGPQVGLHALLTFARALRARAAAVEGDVPGTLRHAEAARASAREHGQAGAELYVITALGLLELGRARPAAAAERLAEAPRLARETGVRNPVGVPWHADLVEALHGACRSAEARDRLAELEELGTDTGSRFARAAAARCRALLGDPSWPDIYEAAVADQHDLPFECGRTLLHYGARLRRARRVRDARERLAAAADLLTRAGARPWAERARAELRAAGVAPAEVPPPVGALTGQELRVCLTVAAGATNKEAAAALFLSPKTVEFHLGRAFAKLGVTHRTQLARLVAEGALGPG